MKQPIKARKVVIQDEGHDEMPLEQARSVAKSVAHRQGGTDKTLARLDKEITRYNAAEELIVNTILGEYDELEAGIPDQLWENINGNREATARALRFSVIVSKRKLRELITAAFADGRN